jgi:hypothetical protein
MIIILFICFILFVIGAIAIPLALLVTSGQANAKRDARVMLEDRKVEDWERFQKVSTILANMPNDLEAKDLWKKLEKLRNNPRVG